MKPIFLVGYMGCGKSTLGRKLAQRLGMSFFDTDNLIEESEGAAVSDIFQYEGEECFRELEQAAVRRILTEGEACVVSTGGGLPAWRDNMELMNGMGHTLYLKRTPEQIARRLSPYGRHKRPKMRGLNDEELLDFMICNLAERAPFYERAHSTVECDGMSDSELIDRILHKVIDGR